MGKAEVQAYFDQVVFTFIKNDMENCMKAQANFAVAQCLVSYTEILGGLLTGNLGLNGQVGANSRAGLAAMSFNGDAKYYGDFRVDLTDEYGLTKQVDLYELVRCGLVHEYFGKGLVVVHNDDKPGALHPGEAGVAWITHGSVERLRFLTNAYFRDLMEAFLVLRERIFVHGDQVALANADKGIERLMKRGIKRV